jgi:hypothetical protein
MEIEMEAVTVSPKYQIVIPFEETADLVVSVICLWTQDEHFRKLPGVKCPGRG